MLCAFTSYFTNVTENDNSVVPSIARGSIYTYVSNPSWVKFLFPTFGGNIQYIYQGTQLGNQSE